MPLSDGDTFAGYRVQRLLGAGDTGEVYLAQHSRLPRLDALKILPASLSTDDNFRVRFERDAEAAETLFHPHIVAVHDHGEDDGRLWIAMDYIDGTDAKTLLSSDYPVGMPINLVLEIVSAVAEALDFAHDKDVVHGGVKPSNILLGAHHSSRKRRIWLADFGIPHQVDDGRARDGRSDQHALAATTYALLTNGPLYDGPKAPPPLAVDHPALAQLDEILAKAMAASPDDRYDRCLDFSDALMAAHTGAPPPPDIIGAPIDLGKRSRRWTKKKITIAVLASIGIVATLSTVAAGVVAGFFSFTQPAPSPTTNAEPTTTTTVPAIPIAPLMVRPVIEAYYPQPDQCVAPPAPVPPTDELFACDIDGAIVFKLSPMVLELQLTNVGTAIMPNMSAAVQIELSEESQVAFAQFTGQNIGMKVAFVRDGVVVSTPDITAAIDSRALQLAGELTTEQADVMVTMLRDGH